MSRADVLDTIADWMVKQFPGSSAAVSNDFNRSILMVRVASSDEKPRFLRITEEAADDTPANSHSRSAGMGPASQRYSSVIRPWLC